MRDYTIQRKYERPTTFINALRKLWCLGIRSADHPTKQTNALHKLAGISLALVQGSTLRICRTDCFMVKNARDREFPRLPKKDIVIDLTTQHYYQHSRMSDSGVYNMI